MPTLLPHKTRTELARSLHRDVVNQNDFLYLAFGHTKPWGPGLGEVVPTPTDTRMSIADAQNNIMAVKRIKNSDVVLMVPRTDWTSGVKYDRYDDSVDLSTKNFFVYVPSNNCIYKCLNVPTPWVASTSQPLSSTAEKFQTADGYWWKLVYEIPTADRDKFITTSYLPVRFYSSSTTFDYSGAIAGFTMTNQGTGYTTTPTVIITGDGKGAAGTANLNAFGEITGITLVAQGTGYTFAVVTIVGDGANATATAQLLVQTPADVLNTTLVSYAQATAGQIDFIDIISGGSNYSYVNTFFQVVGDGHDAVPTVSYTNGAISAVTTGNSGDGNGYTFATVAISSGSGSGAVLKPIIGPPNGHGSNVPTELLATTVGISIDVSDVLTDFFINNDFRQVSVVKNIHKYGVNADIFTNDTGDASYIIGVSDFTKYHLDDTIFTDGGGVFTVININGGNIKLLPSIDIIALNSVLSNATTAASLAPMLALTTPTINKKSGDIIYLKNITPITRAVNQTETLKLFLHF